MNSHKHARLTAKGRALLVSRVLEEGWTRRSAAEAAGISVRTVSKWLARYRALGAAGLVDRSSRPRRSPRALSEDEIERLRTLRHGRWPLWRMAQETRRGIATVSRCMKRLGLSRLQRHRWARAPHHRPAAALQPRHRLGHGAPGHRRSLACLVRPHQDRRVRPQLRQVPARGRGLLRQLAGAHRPRHDRQRHRLSLQGLRRRLHRARRAAHPNSTLHAQDQWQGRTLRADQRFCCSDRSRAIRVPASC
jgi:transposase